MIVHIWCNLKPVITDDDAQNECFCLDSERFLVQIIIIIIIWLVNWCPMSHSNAFKCRAKCGNIFILFFKYIYSILICVIGFKHKICHFCIYRAHWVFKWRKKKQRHIWIRFLFKSSLHTFLSNKFIQSWLIGEI